MNRFMVALVLLLVLSGCVRSQTSLQKPSGPSSAPSVNTSGLREIVDALPEVGGNVTVHTEPVIVPAVDNPFPELV